MASTYSPNLRLELIGTGEQQGTWGTTTNTNLGTLLEEAIGGYTSVTVSDVGDTTLTTNNGSADQSRNMVINLVGTISAARTVLCPAIEKLYVVKNATTGGYAVTFKVSGQTGVTIPNGETYFLYVNGIDVQKIVGNVASTNVTNTFTENQIIQVTDNTDAALRITQLGNGDALLVEDSSNPDSSPFVVKASGYVGIGLTDPSEALEVNGNVLLETSGSGGNSPFLTLKNTSGATPDSFGPSIAFDNSVANTHGFVIGQFQSADSPLTISNSESPYNSYMLINQDGNVNIGLEDDPGTVLQITGLMSVTAYVVGSISGTTLTVTSVGGGTVSVGDRLISGTSIDYNTYITAFGTGTGLTGTYTINNPTTLGSSTIYFLPSSYNTIGFVDTNTSTGDSTPFGGIEWYSSDATSPGAGVKAYVAAITESISPDSALIFGTADTAQAVERMRISSSGYLGIGKKSPATPLDMEGQFRSTSGSVDFRINPLSGSSATVIGNASNSDLVVYTNNTEKMRITAAGRVGIGSANPQQHMEVVGTALTPSSQTTYALGVANSGGASGDLCLGSDGTYAYLQSFWGKPLYINSQGNNIVTGSGNFGIGLTSPSNKLHVNGAAQATTFEVGNASDTTISRSSAGVIAVEGGVVPLENRSNTFTAGTNTFEGSSTNTNLNINSNNSGQTTATNRLRLLDTAAFTSDGQPLGIIQFGTSDPDSPSTYTASIQGLAGGSGGGGALVFYTATNGNSSSESFRISGSGVLSSQATYDNTNAGAANMVVTSSGNIRRSTSSIKYKKDVEDLNDSLADNAVAKLRPVWYRSKNPNGDDKDTWSHIGLIAEEVALVEPRLVSFRTVSVSYDEDGRPIEAPLETPEPEGVDYARLSVILLDVVQRQAGTISSLEARIAALETKVK